MILEVYHWGPKPNWNRFHLIVHFVFCRLRMPLSNPLGLDVIYTFLVYATIFYLQMLFLNHITESTSSKLLYFLAVKLAVCQFPTYIFECLDLYWVRRVQLYRLSLVDVHTVAENQYKKKKICWNATLTMARSSSFQGAKVKLSLTDAFEDMTIKSDFPKRRPPFNFFSPVI